MGRPSGSRLTSSDRCGARKASAAAERMFEGGRDPKGTSTSKPVVVLIYSLQIASLLLWAAVFSSSSVCPVKTEKSIRQPLGAGLGFALLSKRI